MFTNDTELEVMKFHEDVSIVIELIALHLHLYFDNNSKRLMRVVRITCVDVCIEEQYISAQFCQSFSMSIDTGGQIK